MTLSDRRLGRLLPALSAQERVLLMLRDSKAEKPQDRQLLNTAPDRQTSELNRLIGMMNAANGDLAHLIVIIRERVRQDDLRLDWLQWARICALEMWAVRAHFNVSAREAITESEYHKREEEDARELLPIDECAMILTEEHDTWDDADCEMDEDGERSPSDDAWYRMRDGKIAELRALVAAGTLTGKGKGKRMKIACGSFYAWLGQPVPVVPELGIEFDVRPDDRGPEVARARRDHEFIQGLLDRGACNLELPLDMESPLIVEAPKRFGVELARVLAVTIRTGVRENWQELRAIEAQVDAITEEFDGEDVLHARVRGHFDDTKAMLIDLHEQLQEYTGPLSCPSRMRTSAPSSSGSSTTRSTTCRRGSRDAAPRSRAVVAPNSENERGRPPKRAPVPCLPPARASAASRRACLVQTVGRAAECADDRATEGHARRYHDRHGDHRHNQAIFSERLSLLILKLRLDRPSDAAESNEGPQCQFVHHGVPLR
jgi:hypothetical protein